MAPRVLVLFARAPRSEALGKGLDAASGERLFAAFAKAWIDAAKTCGARVVVATPSGDRPAWRRALTGARFEFLEQRGSSLGRRLEDSARKAAATGGCVVLVGGDVAPSAHSLAAAFELREGAADAVISPAGDGGVSLVSLRKEDLDLLARFVPRASDVFFRLSRALALRGRRVAVVAPAHDVDGRRELGRLLRTTAFPSFELEALARAVLDEKCWSPGRLAPRFASLLHVEPHASRGPPRAA
ncbi:MAG: DUF2064 domain-containing protein [Acidobacteriota bacterium]|nr:DUF2064 domain-containing protein [Acidobacteriota bacterium]MDQ5870806.1 DUF2064 domain-containing protein [Acidobacteriota bacterium]